jgi:hypothetical protein
MTSEVSQPTTQHALGHCDFGRRGLTSDLRRELSWLQDRVSSSMHTRGSSDPARGVGTSSTPSVQVDATVTPPHLIQLVRTRVQPLHPRSDNGNRLSLPRTTVGCPAPVGEGWRGVVPASPRRRGLLVVCSTRVRPCDLSTLISGGIVWRAQRFCTRESVTGESGDDARMCALRIADSSDAVPIIPLTSVCCCQSQIRFMSTSVRRAPTKTVNSTSSTRSSLLLTDVSALATHRLSRVCTPRSERQVLEMLEWARKEGRRVIVAGAAHTMGSHTLCEDGLLLQMKFLNSVQFDTEKRTVTAQAGAKWSEVIRVLNMYGRTPRTLQSYCSFTVIIHASIAGCSGLRCSHCAEETFLLIAVLVPSGRWFDRCQCPRYHE